MATVELLEPATAARGGKVDVVTDYPTTTAVDFSGHVSVWQVYSSYFGFFPLLASVPTRSLRVPLRNLVAAKCILIISPVRRVPHIIRNSFPRHTMYVSPAAFRHARTTGVDYARWFRCGWNFSLRLRGVSVAINHYQLALSPCRGGRARANWCCCCT